MEVRRLVQLPSVATAKREGPSEPRSQISLTVARGDVRIGAMEQRWTWTTKFGQTTYEHSVTLDASAVTEFSSGSMPRERRSTFVETFTKPHLLRGPEPVIRFQIFGAIASCLTDAELASERDRTRLAFWRAYDPERVRAEVLAFVTQRPREAPTQHVIRLDGLGMYALEYACAAPTHYLPDDVFVHGPSLPSVPLHTREVLRSRLFAALRPGHGLTREQSFPRLDHARMTGRSWSWDRRQNGETGLVVAPGCVTAGYQYEHDMGWSDYAPERVLSKDPRVALAAPPEVEQEVLADLALAVMPDARAAVSAAGAAPPDAFFALRARAIDRAPWNHSVDLQFSQFEEFTVSARPHDWASRAALGLYASLRPDAELPTSPLRVDERAHKHSYNWKDDAAWLAEDGTGVLLAQYCFGGSPGDGVNDVFHILPNADRRVCFEICTDSTQNTLDVTLSADDEARLASLSEHVAAYFRCFGLAAPATKATGTGLIRIDTSSA